MAAGKEILQVEGREVKITNPDKVFFPKNGHNKLELVRYYLAFALGALRRAKEREVAITNPDKVFFPKTGHTKLDLVRYYLAVAPGALRGVNERPMALKRYVNGVEGQAFYQKRAPENRPDWIGTVELKYPSGRS